MLVGRSAYTERIKHPFLVDFSDAYFSRIPYVMRKYSRKDFFVLDLYSGNGKGSNSPEIFAQKMTQYLVDSVSLVRPHLILVEIVEEHMSGVVDAVAPYCSSLDIRFECGDNRDVVLRYKDEIGTSPCLMFFDPTPGIPYQSYLSFVIDVACQNSRTDLLLNLSTTGWKRQGRFHGSNISDLKLNFDLMNRRFCYVSPFAIFHGKLAHITAQYWVLMWLTNWPGGPRFTRNGFKIPDEEFWRIAGLTKEERNF